MPELTVSVYVPKMVHGDDMRTDYIEDSKYRLLYSHMMYDNALALEVSLRSGLRINDVLKIQPADLQGDVLSFVAEKTGKPGTVRLPHSLADRLRRNGSKRWCFPHRTRADAHRTRQAVWKDVKRAADLLKAVGDLTDQNVAPHSARKTFAVDDSRMHGVAHTQEALQHDSRSTTEIYTRSPELVGVPPSYTDFSILLQRYQKLEEKVTKMLILLEEVTKMLKK